MTDARTNSQECVTLLLVDIQKDFHPGGSLAIPTADQDAHRIAQLIHNHSSKITRVVATMDSHVKLHIANPGFWVSGTDGVTHPDPFTIIESKDVMEGKWKPRTDLNIPEGTLDESIFGSLKNLTKEDGSLDLWKYAIEYTKRLEERSTLVAEGVFVVMTTDLAFPHASSIHYYCAGKLKVCIWPEHCLIGSSGHCMVDEVHNALQEWSAKTGGTVEWVLKGQNLLTESYSALVGYFVALVFWQHIFESLCPNLIYVPFHMTYPGG
jgi:nicotinamidase-related amidase